MTGMEISRIFYARYVQPMLERDFASERHLIAVGLAGQGSECLGFDDELSRDHDFGPGVCLWIPRSEAGDLGSGWPRHTAACRRTYRNVRPRQYAANAAAVSACSR